MVRISLIALSVYAYGGATFDGMRPGVLDSPVRTFHGDVNHSLLQGMVVLREVNGVRQMSYLDPYVEALADYAR